ncbi:MAG: hypothetical protein GY782_10840 [Gammaproteobacteria bacterium]|nr:hypothetical protein [Gammaproteobacteria bacterium]
MIAMVTKREKEKEKKHIAQLIQSASPAISSTIITTNIIIQQKMAINYGIKIEHRKRLKINPVQQPVPLQKISTAVFGHASQPTIRLSHHIKIPVSLSRSLFWQWIAPFLLFLSARLLKEENSQVNLLAWLKPIIWLLAEMCNKKMKAPEWNISQKTLLNLAALLLIGLNITLIFFNPVLLVTIVGIIGATIAAVQILKSLVKLHQIYKDKNMTVYQKLGWGSLHLLSIAMNIFTLGTLYFAIKHILPILHTLAASSANSIKQKVAMLKTVAALSAQQIPGWLQMVDFIIFCTEFALVLGFSLAWAVGKLRDNNYSNGNREDLKDASVNSSLSRTSSALFFSPSQSTNDKLTEEQQPSDVPNRCRPWKVEG